MYSSIQMILAIVQALTLVASVHGVESKYLITLGDFSSQTIAGRQAPYIRNNMEVWYHGPVIQT